VVYAGAGDKSDPSLRSGGAAFSIGTGAATAGHCSYTVSVYQTEDFRNAFTSGNKNLYTLLIALIFGVTALAFFVYDFVVQRRNSLVLQTAAKFNTIVSSLFPSNIRGRLFADKEKDYIDYTTAKSQMKNFLTKGGDMQLAGEDEEDDGLILRTKPMADLFTDTTIMFADVRVLAGNVFAGCDVHSQHSSRRRFLTPFYQYSVVDMWFHGLEFCARAESGVHSVGDCLPSL
jgi:hypothetical protein